MLCFGSAFNFEIKMSMTIPNQEQCHDQGYQTNGQSPLYFLSTWYTAWYFLWVSGSKCHFCFCALGDTKDTTRLNQKVWLSPGSQSRHPGEGDGKTCQSVSSQYLGQHDKESSVLKRRKFQQNFVVFHFTYHDYDLHSSSFQVN